MVPVLEDLTGLGAELARRARSRGLGIVWRAQARRVLRVTVHRGRIEDLALSRASGHGIHVVTGEGRTALGSRDDFREDEALALFEHTATAAEAALDLGVEPRPLAAREPLVARSVPDVASTFADLDGEEIGRALASLESEIVAAAPGTSARVAFVADLDAWRIVREDGTDVLFAAPRCTLRASLAAEESRDRHLVGASVSGPSPTLPFDGPSRIRFLRRAASAALLARSLPDAPRHPSGPHPVVLDYALAKGLAHEAFGHASESDGLRTSVLARDGRFREGERVGAAHVSIVDEPVEGDHAWQPYSADGERRRRVAIVERGRLGAPLSDGWSHGAPSSGASRAESYRNPPLPRMSNIRIEVDAPLPVPGAFEDYGPEEVRALLTDAGVFRRHPRIAYLSGYSGGQVNPVTGDFVFQCKAIWALDGNGVALHRPAIFSGSMFGALESVREAFGPLELDAIGTCGKGGQGVPSSGGSHRFLLLDPDPSVRLGGE